MRKIHVVCPLPSPKATPRIAKLAELFSQYFDELEIWGMGALQQNLPPNFKLLCAQAGARRTGGDYLRWLWRVFKRALGVKAPASFYCVGLDSALPVYLASLLKRFEYVYDNNDNFALRYNWGKLLPIISFIETRVARAAKAHIVPGKKRWEPNDSNLVIIPNSPTASMVERARQIARDRGYARGEKFTLYVNGWLTQTRGIDQLYSALEGIGRSLQIIVAGKPATRAAEKLLKEPFVEYLGEMDPSSALALNYRAHAVFTYYDPALPINRLAEPNKWADCVVTRTAFIANNEIETLKPYEEAGGCFSCGYSDVAALRAILQKLIADPTLAAAKGERLGELKLEPWDVNVLKFLRATFPKDPPH